MPELTGATIDPTGTYRYLLWRTLATPIARTCLFVMLNPSTADATLDDPTIRRCRGFAERLDCNHVEVVNLFAFRATKPANIPRDALRARGPENDNAIHEAVDRAAVVIGGWGATVDTLPKALRDDAARTIKLLRESAGARLHHLGELTASGQPRHPLYLPNGAALQVLGGA